MNAPSKRNSPLYDSLPLNPCLLSSQKSIHSFVYLSKELFFFFAIVTLIWCFFLFLWKITKIILLHTAILAAPRMLVNNLQDRFSGTCIEFTFVPLICQWTKAKVRGPNHFENVHRFIFITNFKTVQVNNLRIIWKNYTLVKKYIVLGWSKITIKIKMKICETFLQKPEQNNWKYSFYVI